MVKNRFLMKISLNLKDLIYITAIVILSWLAFRNTSVDNTVELDRVKSQRDSIIEYSAIKSRLNAEKELSFADSCRKYVSYYVKADSINHYKIRHEKGKISHYTPADTKHAIDSILAVHNRR